MHGENIPEVSEDRLSSFDGVVRRTLNHYLALASEHDCQEPAKLLELLDDHPDRPALIEWLRTNAGAGWTRYLDSMCSNQGAGPQISSCGF